MARTIVAGWLFVVGCTGDPVVVGARVPPVNRVPDVTPPTFTALDGTCATALSGPFEDSLPVLAATVEEDDHTAYFDWDGEDLPDAYQGARICWGPSEDQLIHASLFTTTRGQIFGVTNGTPYVAVIQAIDAFGNVSAPSEVIHFTGSSARVDQLRSEMTGFFDDFNLSQGGLDERLWNVAYSTHDPTGTSTFIGQNQHAVSMLGTSTRLPGSRPTEALAQNVARPRAVFDFAGREGRIVFDLDGAEGARHSWYVDVVPYANREDTIDLTAHTSSDPGSGYPGRFLRFTQSGGQLIIHQYDANGEPINVVRGDVRVGLGFGEYMRHVELRISRDRAAIYMDGELQLENDQINLDFDRSIVHWAQFGYNLLKMERPWSTFMWDNFGFDGPLTSMNTLNYVAGFNGSELLPLGWVTNPPDYEMTGSRTIRIPDPIDGAIAARLFYTRDGGMGWLSGDQFRINGQAFPMPEPATDIEPHSASIAIPTDALITGDNTVEVTMNSGTILNVHLEIDFDPASERTYTQPSDILGRTPVLDLPTTGPDAFIASIDGTMNGPGSYQRETAVEYLESNSEESVQVAWREPLRGTVRVNVAVWTNRARAAYRQNLGVSRVELLVDGVAHVAFETDTAVAPPEILGGPYANLSQPFETPLDLMLDTTAISNGTHTLQALAYDSNGVAGGMTTQYITPVLQIDVAN